MLDDEDDIVDYNCDAEDCFDDVYFHVLAEKGLQEHLQK